MRFYIILFILLCYNRNGEPLQFDWGTIPIQLGTNLQSKRENPQHNWEKDTTESGQGTTQTGTHTIQLGQTIQQKRGNSTTKRGAIPRMCCIHIPKKL